MLSINSNYASAFASNAANTASKGLDSAMEKLSTGSRINYAKDDAAGQAISTRLSAEIQGLAMASRNAADAQSMLDTAEGALAESSSVLLRMRELSVQAANGTLSSSDNEALDAEFQQLVSELTRIAENTTFAGNNLLNGSFAGTTANPALQFQIGEGSGQTINVSIAAMDATALNLFDATTAAPTVNTLVDILNATNAASALTDVDAAIETVSTARGALGAVSNRLDSTMNNLDQVAVNLTSSRGRIEDADFAAETANLARTQVLQQASMAMLAQANASKQNILTLIQ